MGSFVYYIARRISFFDHEFSLGRHGSFLMREVTAGHEVESEVGGTILTWGHSFNEPGHGGW